MSLLTKIIKIRLNPLVYIPLLGVFFVVASVFIINSIYTNILPPNTYINGVKVGGLNIQEASKYLDQNITTSKSLSITASQTSYVLDTKSIDISFDSYKNAVDVHNYFNGSGLGKNITRKLSTFFVPKYFTGNFSYDETKLNNYLAVLSSQATTDPVYPSVELVDGNIIVNRGTPGTFINTQNLKEQIINAIDSNVGSITATIETKDPSIDEKAAEKLKNRAGGLVNKSISLEFEGFKRTYSGSWLVSTINPAGGNKEEVLYSEIVDMSSQINKDPKNSVFVFEDNKVKEFSPSEDGLMVNQLELKNMLVDALKQLESSDVSNLEINIPVDKTPPQITTGEINNLGIKQLIGKGTSKFAHSIPSRVFNVGLASSKFNGVLVAPGEIFSFNKTLGDVSKFTGYKEAYIIKDGKTILGDGGGVCQVSTTLFRAAMNAGLPIVERSAHTYRVGYYEQDSAPGIDATVYSPAPDLKFKNDTPGYILIQTKFDPSKYSLIFEIYGTSDGRVAAISKPVVSNVTNPEEDLYVDDPSLPEGQIKQIEYRANGAKVTFKYTVTRGDEILINKVFTSNYKPWRAVYLRGTGPAI